VYLRRYELEQKVHSAVQLNCTMITVQHLLDVWKTLKVSASLPAFNKWRSFFPTISFINASVTLCSCAFLTLTQEINMILKASQLFQQENKPTLMKNITTNDLTT